MPPTSKRRSAACWTSGSKKIRAPCWRAGSSSGANARIARRNRAGRVPRLPVFPRPIIFWRMVGARAGRHERARRELHRDARANSEMSADPADAILGKGVCPAAARAARPAPRRAHSCGSQLEHLATSARPSAELRERVSSLPLQALLASSSCSRPPLPLCLAI